VALWLVSHDCCVQAAEVKVTDLTKKKQAAEDKLAQFTERQKSLVSDQSQVAGEIARLKEKLTQAGE